MKNINELIYILIFLILSSERISNLLDKFICILIMNLHPYACIYIRIYLNIYYDALLIKKCMPFLLKTFLFKMFCVNTHIVIIGKVNV